MSRTRPEVRNPELLKNAAYLQHRKEMRIISIIGAVVIVGILSVGASLVTMMYWSLKHEMKDIAIVIGFGGTVGGLVSTAFAYLVPSPLQTSQRRHTDSSPTGTPDDPISTDDVGKKE